MTTGKEITKQVKELLREANETGRYLYMPSPIKGFNPSRIIRVRTERGLTIADTMTGNIPVSSTTVNKLYIQ